MKAILTIQGNEYQIDLDSPLSIGITLDPFGPNPSCFHAAAPSAHPVVFDDFVCRVENGAPVNFYALNITPHGNGTHTECVGHITKEFEKVHQTIQNPFFLARLITVSPTQIGQDQVITEEALDNVPTLPGQALVIRTLPNTEDKKIRNYSGSNPPYLSNEAMEFILAKGYDHLILDIPSVDREEDDGRVQNHKTFWNYSKKRNLKRTITELAYIPNTIADGMYILNLKVGNVALDAVPSEPVLYTIDPSLPSTPSTIQKAQL